MDLLKFGILSATGPTSAGCKYPPYLLSIFVTFWSQAVQTIRTSTQMGQELAAIIQ